MDLNLHQEASGLEESDPGEALAAYKRLQKENVSFHWKVFLAKAFFPPYAAILAYFATRSYESYRSLNAISCFIVLGFLPAGYVYIGAFAKLKKAAEARHFGPIEKIIGWLANSFLPLISGPFQAFLMFMVAAIMAIVLLLPYSLATYIVYGSPFDWPWDLSREVTFPVIMACIIPVFLVTMSDVSIFPILPIRRLFREIPVGLKENARRIIYFFASLALGFVILDVASSGILNERIPYYLMIIAAAGILTGLIEARIVRDGQLELLLKLFRARCHFRLGQLAEAGYLAKEIERDEKGSGADVTRCLSHALLMLVYGKYGIYEGDDIVKYTQEARDHLKTDSRLGDLYMDNIEKTEDLLAQSIRPVPMPSIQEA